MILADRDMVEQQSEELFRDADKEDIAFLVVGDPFGWVTWVKMRSLVDLWPSKGRKGNVDTVFIT